MHTNTTVALKPNFMSSPCYVLYFSKYAYSSITLKIKNLHDKDPKKFALKFFFSKMLSSSLFTMLKMSKTTSSKNLLPSD